MFNWLNRLLRAPRTRGFGVQSPTDYHFIRHVVCQKQPYYAYRTLESKTAHLSKREVEILRFYLRLANHIQDSCPIYIIGKESYGNITSDLRRLFLTAGSKKANVQQVRRIPSAITASDTCLLVMENYESNRELLSQRPLTRVLFDMQDIAVAFCNPKRHKTLYKINL